MNLDLSAPWPSLPIVVFDTETTGVGVGDRIVEVGAVRFEPGASISAHFATRIDPGIPIPAEATAVHGIRDEDVAGKPSIEAVAHELARVAEGALPCAYNASFDRRMLHAQITGTDCPLFDPSFPGWLDPLVIAKRQDKTRFGKGAYTLAAVCQRWGIPFEGAAHSAYFDAVACGKLLFSMLSKGAVKPVPAEHMLRHTERMRAEDQAGFDAFLMRKVHGPNILRGLSLAGAYALGKKAC